MPSRKFETVKLLKVYLEDAEFERLSDLAKQGGRTLTGFARDVLVRECGEGHRTEAVRESPPIRVDRGRTPASGRGYRGRRTPKKDTSGKPKCCRHGLYEGGCPRCKALDQ